MGVPGLGERSHVLRNPPITKLFLAHENLIEEQTNHKKKKKMTVQIKTTALITLTTMMLFIPFPCGLPGYSNLSSACCSL